MAAVEDSSATRTGKAGTMQPGGGGGDYGKGRFQAEEDNW